jgi:hypothetical protein
MKTTELARATLICGILIYISLISIDLSSAKIDPGTALGLWFFDEGKGDTAKDSSKNGNDGEIVDAKWADGKFGKALEFEGAGHVSVGEFADYKDKVSIVALIKTPTAPHGLT